MSSREKTLRARIADHLNYLAHVELFPKQLPLCETPESARARANAQIRELRAELLGLAA